VLVGEHAAVCEHERVASVVAAAAAAAAEPACDFCDGLNLEISN